MFFVFAGSFSTICWTIYSFLILALSGCWLCSVTGSIFQFVPLHICMLFWKPAESRLGKYQLMRPQHCELHFLLFCLNKVVDVLELLCWYLWPLFKKVWEVNKDALISQPCLTASSPKHISQVDEEELSQYHPWPFHNESWTAVEFCGRAVWVLSTPKICVFYFFSKQKAEPI